MVGGTRTVRFFWLVLASVVVFAVVFGFHLSAEITIARAHEQRFESYQLADELRQSSDDPTRMTRTTMATGEQRTQDAVHAAQARRRTTRTLLVLSGITLAMLFWGLLRAIRAEHRTRLPKELELRRHRENLEQLVEERTAELIQRNRQLTEEIDARQRAVEKLDASERRFRFIAENTRDVIWVLDVTSGRFTYVSPSVREQRGFAPEQVMAEPMDSSLTKESADAVHELLATAVAAWKAGERPNTLHITDLLQPHRDGHVIHTEVLATLHGNAEGDLASVVGVTRDVTARKKEERAVRRLAFHDGLTDLPNRRLMSDRLEQAIARARREQSRVALLFVDLDRFKPVNDELGHDTGDQLLQVTAQRISECLRETDTAARLGGDEFVVVLPNVQDASDALTVAGRIHESIEQPFHTVQGERIVIGSSIGVACYPDHAGTAGDLLRAGDRAMYRAKRNGRSQVHMLPLLAASSLPPSADQIVGLRWDASYSCGHSTIDAEHRELFRVANRLFDLVVRLPTDIAALAPAFEELLQHVALHFQHEEEILRAAGYPQLDEHAALHQRLLDRAFRLAGDVRTRGATAGDLVDYLATELVREHIVEEDTRFYSTLARSPTQGSPSHAGISM